MWFHEKAYIFIILLWFEYHFLEFRGNKNFEKFEEMFVSWMFSGDSDPLASVLCGLSITTNCSQPTQNSYERVGVYFSVGYTDMREVFHGDFVFPTQSRDPAYTVICHLVPIFYLQSSYILLSRKNKLGGLIVSLAWLGLTLFARWTWRLPLTPCRVYGIVV